MKSPMLSVNLPPVPQKEQLEEAFRLLEVSFRFRFLPCGTLAACHSVWWCQTEGGIEREQFVTIAQYFFEQAGQVMVDEEGNP